MSILPRACLILALCRYPKAVVQRGRYVSEQLINYLLCAAWV